LLEYVEVSGARCFASPLSAEWTVAVLVFAMCHLFGFALESALDASRGQNGSFVDYMILGANATPPIDYWRNLNLDIYSLTNTPVFDFEGLNNILDGVVKFKIPTTEGPPTRDQFPRLFNTENSERTAYYDFNNKECDWML
jgi:hypothetical protein